MPYAYFFFFSSSNRRVRSSKSTSSPPALWPPTLLLRRLPDGISGRSMLGAPGADDAGGTPRLPGPKN